MVACYLLGDSIALMVAPYLHCSLWARVGEHTNVIARHAHPAPLVIISAGSNDDPNANLSRNLTDLRAGVGFSHVVWILPHEARRAALVSAVAASARDRTVANRMVVSDGVHPRNPAQLARDILNVSQ